MTGHSALPEWDRSISVVLEEMLATGPLQALLERAKRGNHTDLQLRKDVKHPSHSWVTFYFGLTKLLDVHENKAMLWFDAHPTWKGIGGFDPLWRAQKRSPQEITEVWPSVSRYLDQLNDKVGPRYLIEGAIHAAMCRGSHTDYFVIDREWQLAFPDKSTQDKTLAAMSAPILAAYAAAVEKPPWWPGVRDHAKPPQFGTGLDLLAVDGNGDLLSIEVKAAKNLKGLVNGPAQVRVYAELLASWLGQSLAPVDRLNAVLAQRRALGLSPTGPDVRPNPAVIPVLAIGSGKPSPKLGERLKQSRAAMNSIVSTQPDDRISDLQVWKLDDQGGVLDHDWG